MGFSILKWEDRESKSLSFVQIHLICSTHIDIFSTLSKSKYIPYQERY